MVSGFVRFGDCHNEALFLCYRHFFFNVCFVDGVDLLVRNVIQKNKKNSMLYLSIPGDLFRFICFASSVVSHS